MVYFYLLLSLFYLDFFAITKTQPLKVATTHESQSLLEE